MEYFIRSQRKNNYQDEPGENGANTSADVALIV
jgi:hypothetical protein